jgi:hypothetical protein
MDSPGSGQELVMSSCEHGDEPLRSDTTELVSQCTCEAQIKLTKFI